MAGNGPETAPCHDQAVAAIYDAALDEASWPKAVRAIATALDAQMVSLEVFDADTGAATRQTLAAPEFVRSFHDYYGAQFALWHRTDAMPVGRAFRREEFLDMALLRRTEFYNDWWLPQNVGGDSLFANIAARNQPLVVINVHKRVGARFSEAEERSFDGLVGHLIRAVDIHGRLQLARLLGNRPAGEAPDGVAIVDRAAGILHGDEGALATLADVGLFGIVGAGRITSPNRIASPNRSVEHLVRKAASGAQAGEREFRLADGSPVRVTVMPLSPEAGEATGWLTVDKPAAMLLVSHPGARRRARIERLVARHGLTRAEAAVAIEISAGDGRAAAAERLGIRETTVRSHLTAIFDKLDIHRQAELVRLVAGE
jgi:DNA-binding CsgD family transcriptional regulator